MDIFNKKNINAVLVIIVAAAVVSYLFGLFDLSCEGCGDRGLHRWGQWRAYPVGRPALACACGADPDRGGGMQRRHHPRGAAGRPDPGVGR